MVAERCCLDALKAVEPGPVLRGLAQVRRRQLDLALRGEILPSARYAECARRIRSRLNEVETGAGRRIPVDS